MLLPAGISFAEGREKAKCSFPNRPGCPSSKRKSSAASFHAPESRRYGITVYGIAFSRVRTVKPGQWPSADPGRASHGETAGYPDSTGIGHAVYCPASVIFRCVASEQRLPLTLPTKTGRLSLSRSATPHETREGILSPIRFRRIGRKRHGSQRDNR